MTSMHTLIGSRRSTSVAPSTTNDMEGDMKTPNSQFQLPRSCAPACALGVGSWELGVDLVRRVGAQRHLRHAPVADLGGPELVLASALKLVDAVELLRETARLAELAEQLAGQIDFVDLAFDVDVLRGIRVRHIHHLTRARRDADGARRPDVQESTLQISIAVEHLDAAVAGIGDIHEALRVDRDAPRLAELAGRGSGLAPRANELPVLVELRNARVGAEPVRDIDVARRVPCDIGRAVEDVLLSARSRRTTASAATRRCLGVSPAATAARSTLRSRAARSPSGRRATTS